jgi:hypothetical protein
LAYPTSNLRSSKLDPSLALLAVPAVVGLVLLRQSGQVLQQLSQFSESLLQGEQLPILERSVVHNVSKPEALPYKNPMPTDS